MAIEAALLKPIVDSILALAGAGKGARLKSNAEKAVREAIRELLQADPNEDAVAAKLAIAKAAGLLSHEVVLAESMLTKVRSHKAGRTSTAPSPRETSGGGSGRKGAAKTASKQASDKLSAEKVVGSKREKKRLAAVSPSRSSPIIWPGRRPFAGRLNSGVGPRRRIFGA